MASSTLKPGVPITLQELEPSSEMLKQGASLRVTGMYVCRCFLLKSANFCANLFGLQFF
uniref:Uncharacterized protein n=1 Tax=Aegilops tauschii subsp. strangulata TaxID=200361 RepID=A0A453BM78_AEGTS